MALYLAITVLITFVFIALASTLNVLIAEKFKKQRKQEKTN